MRSLSPLLTYSNPAIFAQMKRTAILHSRQIRAAFLLLSFSGLNQAATISWNAGSATTSDWSLGSNWGGAAPSNSDDVVLSSTGTFDPTNFDIPSLTLNSIKLGTTSTTLTAAGSSFTLASGGSIEDNANNTGTFTMGASGDTLTLGGNATFNNTSTSTNSLVVAAIVAGTGNITVQSTSSSRTIQLNNSSNSFTGNFLLNSGILVASDSFLGNAANDIIFGGGTYRAGNSTLGAGRVLDFSSGSGSLQTGSGVTFNANTAGQLTGSNTLTFLGTTGTSGVVSIGAANTGFSGAVIMNASVAGDTVVLRDADSLGQSGSKSTVTMTKGTLRLTLNTATNFGNNMMVNSAASGDTTITVQRASAGAGISHTLGTLSIGSNFLTIDKGSNITSGTAGLIFGATTFTGNPTFTLTSANLSLGNISTGNASRTVTIDSTSANQLHFSGSVAPGDGGETFVINNAASSLAGSTTFDSGSTLTFTLGTSSDKISLWGVQSGEVVFNSNTLSINQGAGFAAGTYTLFDFYSDSGSTLMAHGLASGLGAVTINGGGFTGSIVYNTNTIDLSVAAIPEPSTYLLLFLVGFILLFRYKTNNVLKCTSAR